MEIPGNDFKVKGKAIQDRIKITGEKTAKAGGGPSGAKSGWRAYRFIFKG